MDCNYSKKAIILIAIKIPAKNRPEKVCFSRHVKALAGFLYRYLLNSNKA